MFENHVISRCHRVLPPTLSLAEKSPGNEVRKLVSLGSLKQPWQRQLQEGHTFACLTMKTCSFAPFTLEFHIFEHFAAILVLTWDDLFCSCMEEVKLPRIIEKILQKRKVSYSDGVLAVVNVILALALFWQSWLSYASAYQIRNRVRKNSVHQKT